MKLGIVADTRHYIDKQNRLCALTPVVRQLDKWAELFDEVIVCAPLVGGMPLQAYTPYQTPNIKIEPLSEGGGKSVKSKIGLFQKAVHWVPIIRRVIKKVDALHIRCPCNIGFLGILCSYLSNRHRYAMYAGNWYGYEGEPISYRLQRWLLKKPSFGGPVTVYGNHSLQYEHLVSFFSPSFGDEDWKLAAGQVSEKLSALQRVKSIPSPIWLISVGHLNDNKNQQLIVRAARRLRDIGVQVKVNLIGDGYKRENLIRLRDSLGLQDCVSFLGSLPYHLVKNQYLNGNFNILASKTEGYPKVLLEGMVYGAVPIASDIGVINGILGRGNRGLTFPYGDVEKLVERILFLVSNPAHTARMISTGREYSKTVTIEAFQKRTIEILEKSWKVTLRRPKS
jgi:glycosyltransferase involved in cell wall biosynthesis